MAEETAEAPKKHRGWPKGKPRTAAMAVPPITFLPEPEAPIHVRLRLKNYTEAIEFGCARRFVENGFHVFLYPSERDRYRETRREFAIAEIIEIEITEARREFNMPMPAQIEFEGNTAPSLNRPQNTTSPRIHSVKDNARQVLGEGSIKMDVMPNLTFGDSAG